MNGDAHDRAGDVRLPGARIRVVIVEDHVILKEGLVALLEIEQDLDVVGDAEDVPTALELVTSRRPNVMITDLALPGESGISLISMVRQRVPETRALVLTGHQEAEYIRAAMDAGALGYVLKDASRQELLQAIRAVAAGQQYLSTAIARKVLSGYLRPEAVREETSPTSLITSREREVLALIAAGGTNKTIARELDVSIKTVEKHRSNLMRKLGLRNSAEVTLFAVKHGLVNARALGSSY